MDIRETITILNNRVCTLQNQLATVKLTGQLEAIPAIEADIAGTNQTLAALNAALAVLA